MTADTPASVFLCYANADLTHSRPTIEGLLARGVPLAFDGQIPPGQNWRDEIASAIEQASALLFLLSPNAVASKPCLQELDFALDRDVPILVVELAPVGLSAQMAFRLGNVQHITRAKAGGPVAVEAIVAALESMQGQSQPLWQRPASTTPRGADALPVAVLAQARDAGDPGPLLDAVARHLTWHGGALSARRKPLAGDAGGYHLTIGTHMGQLARVQWQLSALPDDTVLWSQQHTEPAADLAEKLERVAEMIAEGTVQEVYRHRRGLCADAGDLGRLDFWDLIALGEPFQGMDTGLIDRQEGALRLAAQRHPGNAAGHAALAAHLAWRVANGACSKPQETADLAKSSSRQALALDPDNPWVLLRSAMAFGRLGEPQRAVSLGQRAHALAPTAATAEVLATALCFAGQADEAIALLETVRTRMPAGHRFQHGKLAVPLLQTGQLQAALASTTECTTHFPHDWFGWLLHANTLQLLGQPGATQALREAKHLREGLDLPTVILGIERTYGGPSPATAPLTDGLRQLLV